MTAVEWLVYPEDTSSEVIKNTEKLYAWICHPHEDPCPLELLPNICLEAKYSTLNDNLLHLAARYGHGELCRALIAAGLPVDSRNLYNETPLHKAAEWDHLECARILLEEKADIHAVTNPMWETPLHYAAEYASPQMLQLFIDRGARVNAQDAEQKTPLHKAAAKGYLESARTLMDYGAIVDTPSIRGDTPLHEAAANRHRVLCKYLLRHGASVHHRNNEGETPLRRATNDYAFTQCEDEDLPYPSDFTAIAALLMSHGARINDPDNEGETAAHFLLEYAPGLAAEGNNKRVKWYEDRLRGLLECGMNIYAENSRGHSIYTEYKKYTNTAADTGRPNTLDMLCDDVDAIRDIYTDFQQHRTAPETKEWMLSLLAATPLADPRAPIDQQAQLRRIFAHAQWQPGQAAAMASELQQEGLITAAFAEELIAIAEPRKIRRLTIAGRGV